MKLFIKLRNKYFMALASLILLVMASMGLFNLCGSVNSVDASMISFDNESSITITNGSFSSFSSSASYPYTVSGYTTSGNTTPSMKTGAINISDSTYAKNYEKYGLTEYGNPKGVGKDNYVLMINTQEDSDYTYTSNEFTLPANGCYYITVSAKVIGDNGIASVFLMQDNTIFEDCIISNITSTTWSNYTFFVATNSYESVTLKFGMQIGSQSTRASGCVLFDELHAGQISQETLSDCLMTFSEKSYKYAELRTPNMYKAYGFGNVVVEFAPDADGNNVPNPIADINYFATLSSGGDKKSAEISNGTVNISTTNGYVNYTGQEEILQPNSTYRFSIFAKASELTSGSGFVKLEEILDEEDEKYEDFMDSTTEDLTAKNSNLTISSVTSNKMTDGYNEYIIYVNTGALETSKVKFSFGLGTSSTKATGEMSFKNFTIERVPYSAYSKASTSSTVGKFNIADRISLNSSEYSNYTFDMIQSNSFDGVQYPAEPTNWTVSNGANGYQLSGVVNLSAFDSVMNKYANKVNTISAPASLTTSSNNNVLMIYNGIETTQSYTSQSKSLSANKYYKITTFVNTHLWDKDASGVTVVAKTGSNVLAQATGIKTSDAWQRVELYIHTPANSVDVSLELSLGYGNNLSSGYAFFDNILIEESDTEGEFSSRFNEFTVATNGSVTVDLNNSMLTSTTSRDFNTPVLYTGTNNGNTTINAGIVDLTQDLKSIITTSKVEALRELSGDNRKVLAISTALDMDGYYTYTSVLKYNFESGKYYKLSFDLFTDGISQQDKDEKYDNGKLAEGANIELTGLENSKFTYVTSNGKWTTYEFYVGVNSSTTSNLLFSLGSEFTGCYGKAFLGNINLVEVEEDVFTSTENADTVLKVSSIEETEDDETEESTKSETNFDWVYIPTILTFLAIVVAVVGVFVRRNIKFKKTVKNKKAVYDRDTTVMQNRYRRLAIDARDKEVRELTKECEELINLRSASEERYKEALSRLRSARLSNRDGSKRNEIAAIEREVKHISKEVARLGVQVNNYENEIEFMQTEAYLIDLEKRMARESNYNRNQMRKEAQMSEEEREIAIAKREEKQARQQEKEDLKAEKLAKKQEKFEQERKEIELQLAQAKELDEKFVKEQELKRIQLEQERLAKEQEKAEKEAQKQQTEQEEALKADSLDAEQQEIVDASASENTSVKSENVDAEIKAQDVETIQENSQKADDNLNTEISENSSNEDENN